MQVFFRPKPKYKPLPIEALKTETPQLRGADVAAVYFAQRDGGDFYDFLRVGPSRLLFGMLDVSGNREKNQPILASAKTVFEELGHELLSAPDVNESEAMTRLCLTLNREIMDTAGGVHSSPAFAGCYNEDLGTVCYVNSGHTPGLLLDGGQVSELKATALPLGLFSMATVDAPIVALPPGAALLLVSRGVVEAECGGNEFGLEGTETSLKAAMPTDAKKLVTSVMESVQSFTCIPPTHNDVTALALVRHSNSSQPS
jgi:sigma-B regulation protein RsbU (phosphoserine phosphatase)